MKSIIRFFFFLAVSSNVFSQPAFPTKPNCTDSSRECVISTAQKYLDALVSHNPDNIPLASDVTRWENGVNTATNSDTIRMGIKNNIGFKSIKGIRNVKWFVDGSTAIAYYLIDVNIPYTSINSGTTHIVEKFVVENGLIKDIEAIFCASERGKQESDKMLPTNVMPYLCTRSLI